MTIQTKKYIEPQDIIALCFECVRCKAVISLSLSEKIEVKQLAVCPHCQRPWLRLPTGPTIEQDLATCIDKLKVFSGLISKEPYSGFLKLKLEVTRETEVSETAIKT